jgi:hypothetical protein
VAESPSSRLQAKERQMWLTVFAVTLAAAICLNVSAFMMQYANCSAGFGLTA